jgi:glutamyl/glutaminyl-tRNA synthetase
VRPLFKEIEYPPAYGAKEIFPKYKISETGQEISLEFLQKIVAIYQERLKKLSEIPELTDFFFKEKLDYNPDLLKWKEMTEKEIKLSLDKLERLLSKMRPEEFNRENLKNFLLKEAEKFSQEIKKEIGDRGYLLWPLRVALTGKENSAGPFEIAEILGKEKTIKRIREAKKLIK